MQKVASKVYENNEHITLPSCFNLAKVSASPTVGTVGAVARVAIGGLNALAETLNLQKLGQMSEWCWGFFFN